MKLSTLLFTTTTLAALNEPCYGPSGTPGVCITTSSCSSANGTSISNACPKDPSNVKCCSKAPCSGSSSLCGWTSDCAGTSTAGLCPGPSQMQCCSTKTNGWGGYDEPEIPSESGCEAVAKDGARTVVSAWPGRIREIFCTRDCSCPGDSDHCCGKAVDLMCADDGSQATLSGIEIAEWAMENRGTLDLSYVIWGQRIWSVEVDGTEKPWSQWRGQDDRDSITQNHWDHVHLSFN